MTEDSTIDYLLELQAQEDEALLQPCKTDLLPRRRMRLAAELAEIERIYDDSSVEYKP